MTEHRDILGNLLNRLQGFWSDPDALIRRITVLKDDPEFARLTRAYKQKNENPAALLRYLTSLSDDPDLSSLLNAYRQKDERPEALERQLAALNDDPELAKLTRAYKQKDENPAALLRYLTSLSDDPELARLINLYKKRGENPAALLNYVTSTIDDPGLSGLLNAYWNRAERPEALPRQLTAFNTDSEVSRLLNLFKKKDENPAALLNYVTSQIDDPGLSGLLNAYLQRGERPDAILRQLTALLDDPELSKLIRTYQSRNESPNSLIRHMGALSDVPELSKLIEIYKNRDVGDGNGQTTIAYTKFIRSLEIDPTVSDVLKSFEDGQLEDKRFRKLWNWFKQSKYIEDSLASVADAHWLEEARFRGAYRAGKSISVWKEDIRWRVYTLLKCAEKSANLEGDFVECGVDRGGTAMCVMHYLKSKAFKGKKFYLFDTFQGLDVSQLSEEELALTRIEDGRYPNVLAEVEANFSTRKFTKIIPGAVPETLSAFKGKKVAYLHIDMNVAYPEVAALEFFWPLLVKGAPVIFDDYGFPYHSIQRKALDEAAERLGTSIMMLPTCQGLMWKV